MAQVQPLERLKVRRMRLFHDPSWMLLTTMREKRRGGWKHEKTQEAIEIKHSRQANFFFFFSAAIEGQVNKL